MFNPLLFRWTLCRKLSLTTRLESPFPQRRSKLFLVMSVSFALTRMWVSLFYCSLKCADCANADWPEYVYLFVFACSVSVQHWPLLMVHWLQCVQFPSDLDSLLQIRTVGQVADQKILNALSFYNLIPLILFASQKYLKIRKYEKILSECQRRSLLFFDKNYHISCMCPVLLKITQRPVYYTGYVSISYKYREKNYN